MNDPDGQQSEKIRGEIKKELNRANGNTLEEDTLIEILTEKGFNQNTVMGTFRSLVFDGKIRYVEDTKINGRGKNGSTGIVEEKPSQSGAETTNN